MVKEGSGFKSSVPANPTTNCFVFSGYPKFVVWIGGLGFEPLVLVFRVNGTPPHITTKQPGSRPRIAAKLNIHDSPQPTKHLHVARTYRGIP